MTNTTQKKWTRAKQRSLATWIVGTLLFIFLISVFIFAPETIPDFKHRLLGYFAALLAAIFGYFLLGEINLEFAKDFPSGKLVVKAAGGLALFILVLLWWMSPLAPVTEEIEKPQKPYMQVLSGSVRTEQGQPLSDVKVSLSKFGITVYTDNLGRFKIKIKAKHQATVELIAQKIGYQPYEQYATLGNTSMSFTMKVAP